MVPEHSEDRVSLSVVKPSPPRKSWSTRNPLRSRADPPGAKPSIEQIYHAERLPMVRLAVLLVDDLNTAEDVVQDAFSGVFRAWDRLSDEDAVRGYLRTCVVNAARSVLRRRRTARAYVPPVEPPTEGADTSTLLAEEYREALQALSLLPERQREVIVMRYWSELSEAEVASALGISKGTVKSSTSRGLATLRRALPSHPHD
jgi:RNA polymerase sigma-70 factor (sigma-E family)